MKVWTWRSLALVAVALALPLFSQSAKATAVATFQCGFTLTPACAGTVATSGGATLTAASTAGLTVASEAPTPDAGLDFTLKFDTALGTVSLVGPDTLSGTITSFTGSNSGLLETINLLVDFSSLPADFAAYLGAPAGSGALTNIDLSVDGSALTADVNIVGATPEPASYLLMGTGMLLCAFFLRRNIGSASAVTLA
jgi:PEP-CTERM motif-containing protein